MARGWESKSVADQMEAADERALRALGAYELSPVVRARRERIESLKLSVARTLEQLERATRPAHREMLNRTLRSLEAEIDELS
jgi:ribosomal protein S16